MDNKDEKSLKFFKGSLKELGNDDFVIRFIASTREEIKIVYVFIYVTYEYITNVLYLDRKNKKEINSFFQERLEEWKNRKSLNEILRQKKHYLIYGYGNISEMQVKSDIEKEYNG